MNKIFYRTAIIVALIVSTVGCANKEQPKGESWGYTEYFESSIFKSYEPNIMSGELEFNLNPDAQNMFRKGGSLQFQISTDPSKFVAPEGVIVYYNGTKSEDATFTLVIEKAQDVICCDLGFEFEGSAQEGVHQLYILYSRCQTNTNEVELQIGDHIESVPINPNEELTVDILEAGGLYIEKKNIKNPGNVIFVWSVIGVVALFVLSIIVSRMMHARVGVSRIIVTGEYLKQINVRGYRKVVLTSTRKKQGFMNKLFTGTILYEVHPSWKEDVVFVPRNRKSVRMLGNKTYMCSSMYLMRNQTYTLQEIGAHGKPIEIRVL